jgi:hypothetical protein
MEPVASVSTAKGSRKPTPQKPWDHNREKDEKQWNQNGQNDQPLCFTLERKPKESPSH